MPTPRDWSSDLTLLCESCGYVIEGLETDGACPECGRPIRSSLPTHRTGSPWQQRKSLRSWVLTTWRVLASPGRVFEKMTISPKVWRSLLILNILLAAALMSILPAARLAFGHHPIAVWSPASGNLYTNRHAIAPLLFVGSMLSVFAILAILTWIEFLGIRFFHGRRGWRITRDVAWNVCAHSSAGWLLAGLLVFLGWSLIDLDFLLVGPGRPVSLRFRLGDWSALPAVGGAFLGMMIFEIRVYQGVRRCRFANAPRA